MIPTAYRRNARGLRDRQAFDVEFESPDPAAASPPGPELVDLDDGGAGEVVGGQPRDPGGHVALADRVERHVPDVGEHMQSVPGLVPNPRCRPQEQRGPPPGMPVPEPGPAVLGIDPGALDQCAPSRRHLPSSCGVGVLPGAGGRGHGHGGAVVVAIAPADEAPGAEDHGGLFGGPRRQAAPCGRPLRGAAPCGRPYAAVLGRRTPDGGRARIATLASCTTSPASGRTSLERVRRVGEQER
jgi:hypothetical protein